MRPMREHEASRTAAWVAGGRGLGAYLGDDRRLVIDPFGLRFAGRVGAAVGRALDRLAPSTARAVVETIASTAGLVYWMQLRTRVLDDAIAGFVATGGSQLVLLGAGFDARAHRLDSLGTVTVFEVDHPATQSAKRRAMCGEPIAAREVVYLAWNFESEGSDRLPAALAEIGHDATAPTMTVWEGVTMYLSDEAIDATVRAMRAYSSPGSQIVFNYLDRARLTAHRVLTATTALLGEPFRFGFDPPTLGAWLEARGFQLRWDETDDALARRLLPTVRRPFRLAAGRHIAMAAVRS